MRTIELYNIYHLGDCTFQIHYMRKMCNAFEVNFIFYCCKEYHEELQAQIGVYSNRITLVNIEQRSGRAIDTWINSNNFLMRHPQRSNYNQVYADFFKELNNKIGFPYYEFTKDFCIFDNENILVEIEIKPKCDILFINSEPKSGQFNYNSFDFECLSDALLNKGFNLISTNPIRGISCTRDYKMNLVEIASLSKYVKYIIGVHTSPMLMCFNKWNIDTVKNWYVCDGYHGFTYNDRITRHEIFSSLIDKLKIDGLI